MTTHATIEKQLVYTVRESDGYTSKTVGCYLSKALADKHANDAGYRRVEEARVFVVKYTDIKGIPQCYFLGDAISTDYLSKEELEALKAQALKKLTVSERAALGLPTKPSE